MNIKGIQKTSLVDFPGIISTVLFYGGCNLNCRYCYNPELIVISDSLRSHSINEISSFLKNRQGLIDGVVITGGEPTLSDDLIEIAVLIKEIPLKLKIDSNGLKPEKINSLLEKKLIDYAAIDIKTSPEKYHSLTRKKIDFSLIKKTVELLKSHNIDYELRTTCIPEYVTLDDLKLIKDELGPVKRYYLQQYVNKITLDKDFREIMPYSKPILQEFKKFIKTFSEVCEIRGI